MRIGWLTDFRFSATHEVEAGQKSLKVLASRAAPLLVMRELTHINVWEPNLLQGFVVEDDVILARFNG